MLKTRKEKNDAFRKMGENEFKSVWKRKRKIRKSSSCSYNCGQARAEKQGRVEKS